MKVVISARSIEPDGSRVVGHFRILNDVTSSDANQLSAKGASPAKLRGNARSFTQPHLNRY
jgi:hypothetical protein